MPTPFKTEPSCLLAASLLLAPLSGLNLPGCAVDGCEIYPSDPRCTNTPMSDLVLLTHRLAQTGGSLTVQVRNLAVGARVVATLGSSGQMINFTMNSDGTYSGTVSASMLSSVPPGPLSVTVTAGSKMLTQNIHIYVPPSFTDSMKAVKTLSGATPSWVQISQGHVFDAEDSASGRAIFEYAVSGTSLQQQVSRHTLFGYFSTSILQDVTSTQTVLLDPKNAPSYALEAANLDDTVTPYNMFPVLAMLTLAKSDALAADHSSSLVAVAGEGMDGPLKVFTLPAMPTMSQATTPVSLSGGTGKQPVMLGWGLIDEDSAVDLVTMANDNTSAVYLQKGSQGLSYDQTTSGGLDSADNLQGVTLQAFAVGDVDQDGLDDVILSVSNQIVEYANQGDGTFTKSTLVNVAADAIAIGDLNGDGKPDLALAQKAGATVLAYLNAAP